MYNFSQFSVQLNEPEPDVAPTDTRLRPDQRLMEDTKCKLSNRCLQYQFIIFPPILFF